MVTISAVVACTPSYGIGMNGTLPWAAAGVHLPQDMRYFRSVTAKTRDPNKMNAVLMGRCLFKNYHL